MTYELYHLLEHGVDFYGEGDLFEGGGLLEGLDLIRTPLLAIPQEMPPRPGSIVLDSVWQLLTECLATEPAARPTFDMVAKRLSEAREATQGWL